MDFAQLIDAWCKEHRKGWHVTHNQFTQVDGEIGQLRPNAGLDGSVALIYTDKLRFFYELENIEKMSIFDHEFFTKLSKAMDYAERFWHDHGWFLTNGKWEPKNETM